jgi:hypothetical protein
LNTEREKDNNNKYQLNQQQLPSYRSYYERDKIVPETNKSSLIESPSIFDKGAIISVLDPSASRARQRDANSKVSNSQNHMENEIIDSELNSNIIS